MPMRVAGQPLLSVTLLAIAAIVTSCAARPESREEAPAGSRSERAAEITREQAIEMVRPQMKFEPHSIEAVAEDHEGRSTCAEAEEQQVELRQVEQPAEEQAHDPRGRYFRAAFTSNTTSRAMTRNITATMRIHIKRVRSSPVGSSNGC